MRYLIAAVLLGLVVAGCGTISETFGDVGGAPSVPPDPTPAATVDIDATAAAYLALATAFNAALCEHLPAINSGDLAQAKAGQAEVAAASRVLADGMRELQGPWGSRGNKAGHFPKPTRMSDLPRQGRGRGGMGETSPLSSPRHDG